VCSSAFSAARTLTGITAVENKIANNGAAGNTGDTYMVMPGSYTGALNVSGEAGVQIFGDPTSAARPVWTSTTFEVLRQQSSAPGLTVSHMVLATDPAASTNYGVTGAGGLTLDDVEIQSAATMLAVSAGSLSMKDVVAERTGTATVPAMIAYAPSPVTIRNLTIEGHGAGTGLALQNTGAADIDGLGIDLDAGAPGQGGAGMSVLNTTGVSLRHARISAGAFALVAVEQAAPPDIAAVPTSVEVSNSLLTSRGVPGPAAPDGTTLPLAAVFPLSGASIALRNTTAVAGGTAVAVRSSGTVTLGGQPFGPSSMTVSNSILRSGSGDAGQGDASVLRQDGKPQDGSLTIDHSDYRPASGDGVTAGSGNGSDDQLFVNGTLGAGQDFHVRDGSPTLRAGAAVPAGDKDLDGAPRPDTAGTMPDLGAYESAFLPAPPATPTPTPTAVPVGTPAVEAPPAVVPPAAATPAPVVTAPSLSGVTFSASSLVAGSQAVFVLTSSAAGLVKIAISKSTGGRKVAGKCIAQSRKNTKKPKCKYDKLITTISQSHEAGRTSIAFNGTVRGKKLAVGTYKATISVTGATGLVSPPTVITFKVKAKKKAAEKK